MNGTYYYVKNLVLGNINEYKNYLCITDNFNSTSDLNVLCFFSNEFELNDDHLIGNGKKCNINNLNSLIVCNNDLIDVELDSTEMIYTNILNDTYPSIIADFEYQKNNNIAYNIDLNYCVTLLILLVMPIVISLCRRFFYGSKEV